MGSVSLYNNSSTSGGTLSNSVSIHFDDYVGSYGATILNNIVVTSTTTSYVTDSSEFPNNAQAVASFGGYTATDNESIYSYSVEATAQVTINNLRRQPSGDWVADSVVVAPGGTYYGVNFGGGVTVSGNATPEGGIYGFDSGSSNISATVSWSTPAAPTIAWDGGSFPSNYTVNSGQTYRPGANAYSGANALIAILIDKSYDGGSTWVPWAEVPYSYVSSADNTGNNSTDTGSGNTTVLWRAQAQDSYGQVTTIYQTINVNAYPTVSWGTLPSSSPVVGTSYSITANGSDIDTASWGSIASTDIQVLFPGFGSYTDLANDPGSTASYSSTWDHGTGNYVFRASSTDNNGATSSYIYYTVTVVGPTPTPTATTTPAVTPTPTSTPASTPSPTPTSTPRGTPPATPTATPTSTPASTPPATPTPSVTPLPSNTPAPTVTPAATVTPTNTPSYTVTPSVTLTPGITPTPTSTPTSTVTPTPTVTPPPSVSGTPGASLTPTPTPTGTPAVTPTPTVTPASTPGPTVTPTISITPSVTPSTGVLAAYTPWTVATTNSPVWVQSVYPISKNVTTYGINWGDGSGNSYYGTLSGYTSYTSLPSSSNFFLYNYTLPISANIGYTVTVAALAGIGGVPRVLTNRFYIDATLPTYSTVNFYDPTIDTPVLPWKLNDIKIGSNEWAVAGTINNSLQKIQDNFDYLQSVSQILSLNINFNLVEWTGILNQSNTTPLTGYAWRTTIPGLNDGLFNTYNSVSAIGFADGTVKDFKSYRFTNNSAPDYYNYIAFAGLGSNPDYIQVRTNDYYNTLVLSAANIGSFNMPKFNSLSAIDSYNDELFILDTDTVYKVDLNINDGILTPIAQVGGEYGTRSNNIGFNNPVEIKAWNAKIYVADSNNSCVKVYNTALGWLSTLYTSLLSAYSVQRIEVNRANEHVFVLAQTFAPVPPIVTYSTTISASSATGNMYQINFVHDGLRLNDSTSSGISNSFTLYGLISGGTYYSPLTGAIWSNASLPYQQYGSIPDTQTVKYAAASGLNYTNFAVQAIGLSGFNSALSNGTPTPNIYAFKSPYAIFELDQKSNLINAFPVPNNTAYILPSGNIQSNDVINKMVIDPTGAFLYLITPYYIYKYLTTGKALNKIVFPDFDTLGGFEYLKTGFIDDRLNFFLATNTRIFKFVDLPTTLNLYDTIGVNPLFTPLSACLIDSNEFIQDWVYNKSLLRIIQNHEILYKAIEGKYYINLDSNGNLIIPNTSTTSICLTSFVPSDISEVFSINDSYFVHSNELVTSDVINRTLTNIYILQNDILNLVTPKKVKALPSYTSNNL